ncbi:RNase adapter RapZ [Ferrimonas lipolytica]|uniref:RNase adapter RapZ n=1 Tax=Ferrimonas lipolytica TaxID=2724191 RepID=A0A6H1UFL3_9GAMM|nr:RNase adapter RapZ [Ferrimonas lipolytica]QIZ77895.1 RNase adapter RapZ [Ferrimonas lipolytica]
MKLVILSGRSGAGKTVALHVLEDLGYYCVDNLPMPLLLQLLQSLENQRELVAVSLDIRNLPDQELAITKLRERIPAGIDAQIYFLDASDDTLMRRYSETRRRHPLSNDGAPLAEAIGQERSLLQPLAQDADHLINTDNLSVYDLANEVRTLLLGEAPNEMMVVFESFGFKHGMPQQADFMFDVRFLANPHWEPELRPFTGKDKPVADFFLQHSSVTRFIDSTERFILNWLPMLERNNRAYLTIAIGCTGGKHRSVYVVEQLTQRFKLHRDGISVRHRELDVD